MPLLASLSGLLLRLGAPKSHDPRASRLKVGALARRTGVSLRTLHHYDEIGLLSPALGGSGEARLYGRRELERLQHIGSLRALGLSLSEIRACLDTPEAEQRDQLKLHAEEPQVRERWGVEGELWQYMEKASLQLAESGPPQAPG